MNDPLIVLQGLVNEATSRRTSSPSLMRAPGNDQIPVDSLHRHVLAGSSDVDRVPFLLEGVNPLQCVNANRLF